MMQLIRQQQPNHCGVAVLAMLTDLPYYEVVAKLGATLREAGLNEMYMRQFLWDMGYNIRQIYKTDLTKNFYVRKPWPPTPFADKHAVFTTPHHWVAMDKVGNIFDPWKEGQYTLSAYHVYSIIGISEQL